MPKWWWHRKKQGPILNYQHFQHYLGKLKNRKIIESFTNQPVNLSNDEGYMFWQENQNKGEKKNHWFPSDTLQIPVVRNDSLSLIALTAPQSGITLTTLQGNMVQYAVNHQVSCQFLEEKTISCNISYFFQRNFNIYVWNTYVCVDDIEEIIYLPPWSTVTPFCGPTTSPLGAHTWSSVSSYHGREACRGLFVHGAMVLLTHQGELKSFPSDHKFLYQWLFVRASSLLKSINICCGHYTYCSSQVVLIARAICTYRTRNFKWKQEQQIFPFSHLLLFTQV